MNPSLHRPATLGLFQKRIEGDEGLLELARLRFRQAGMGAELHAGSPGEIDWLQKFLPDPHRPVVVHLPRDLNWADASVQNRIADLACHVTGRVQGMVVHDRIEMGLQPEVFGRAARELETRLAQIPDGPVLFIEYAVGLEPEVFAGFAASIQDLMRVSVCVDVGHVGIQQTRNAYSQMHPGQDVCALKAEPSRFPDVILEVEQAVATALPTVLKLIEGLGPLGKPVHFHLHDGHPLSRFSPYGVADHLGFLAAIPIDFEHRGQRSLPLMFGPAGLAAIVDHAVRSIGGPRLSFTLEIHPPPGQRALEDAAGLFGHWRDKTRAEQMNHWLAVLGENHRLLLDALTSNSPNSTRSGVSHVVV